MPEKCVVEMVKYQSLTHNTLQSTKCHGDGHLIACEQFRKKEVAEDNRVCEEICIDIQIPH